MIIGTGTDMTDIRRIEKAINRFGARFIEKCFVSEEITRCEKITPPERRIASYAKLFAGKEAVLKASGLGLRKDMQWHDIVIEKDSAGKPVVRLTGATDKVIKERVPAGYTAQIDISLSDEWPYALAFVVVSYYKE